MINSTLGNTMGDQKIRTLANTMRQYFPKQTYFVRGAEANLIALCVHSSEYEMSKSMSYVDEHFDGKIQYAVSSMDDYISILRSALNVRRSSSPILPTPIP